MKKMIIRNFLYKLFYKKTKKIITGRDSRRSFTITQKKEIWYAQKCKCKFCNKKLDLRTAIYDHKKRWSDGGRSNLKNCQALCPTCNNMKNYKENLNSAEKRRRRGLA